MANVAPPAAPAEAAPARSPAAPVEPPVKISEAPARTAVAPPAFEAGDDFKIEAAVYHYLLEKHPWDEGGPCAAIFLQGKDERAQALIQMLPRQAVPLKPGNQADLRSKKTPIDPETGKPAVLLGAHAIGPTNGVSEAIGTWYRSPDVTGVYAFVLVKTEGQWRVQSVK